MLIKKEDFILEEREKLREGDGVCQLFHSLGNDKLPLHVRLASTIVLKKGCGIGDHPHIGETEIYYGVQGEGVLNDNGNVRSFKAGDISYTGNGEHHSIYNEKEEPLILFAVIITE
jgi:mannose-6-phosphate isomerase-like protein (cupin superfamily)